MSWTKKSMNFVADAIFFPHVRIELNIRYSLCLNSESGSCLIILITSSKNSDIVLTWAISEFRGFRSS